MEKYRSVRFNVSEEILEEFDSFRTRYVSRTAMLSQAMQNYVQALRARGIQGREQQ